MNKLNLKTTVTSLDDVRATRRNLLMFAGASAAALAASACSKAATAEPAPAAPVIAPKLVGPAIMSSNESPWGASPKAIEAMQKVLADTNRYADPETQMLAQQIAEREGVTADMVAIANGSSPILQAFAEIISQKGKGQLVTSLATYEALPRGVQGAGADVIFVPLAADTNFDLDAIAKKISKKTTATYVCNPNNPTGKMVDPAKLKAFAIEASKTVPVFIDEAYIDLADDPKASIMTGLVKEGHNVVVCRTFSKIYAMAGQRIGYCIAPAPLAKQISMKTRLGGVNHLGLVAAMASLKDDAFYADRRIKMKKGRDALVEMAKATGRKFAENPQGNFIFLEVGMPNKDFATKMLAENVKVVGRTWPGYDNWTRICVGTDEETEMCRKALAKVLKA